MQAQKMVYARRADARGNRKKSRNKLNRAKSFQPTARRNLKSLRQQPSKAPKFSKVSKRQTAVTAAKTEINDSCRTHTSSSLEDFEESGDNAAIEESAALLNFRTIQPFKATVFQRWSTLHTSSNEFWAEVFIYYALCKAV